MGDCLKDPDAIDIFCQYISPKLQKINIGGNQVKDHHIRTFVNRCPKITHLYLHATPITNASVPIIVQGLYKTLVKLQLPFYIDFPALTALRYLPNLKYFWYRQSTGLTDEKRENLREILPKGCIINEGNFLVAYPDHSFWEVKSQRVDLFATF